MSLEIPKNYYLPLGAVIGMGLQMQIAAIKAGQARKTAFNKEFMLKHFKEEHQDAFGEEIEDFGYPDMGEGVYSNKLSYKYRNINSGIGITSMSKKEFILIIWRTSH